MATTQNNNLATVWINEKKQKITCKDKIKVLDENIEQVKDLAQEIIDEAILIGADVDQVKNTLNKAISAIKSNLKSE